MPCRLLGHLVIQGSLLTGLVACSEGGTLSDQQAFEIKLEGRWRTPCSPRPDSSLHQTMQLIYQLDEYTYVTGYFQDAECKEQLYTGLVQGEFEVTGATTGKASFVPLSKTFGHAYFLEPEVEAANAAKLCDKEDWQVKRFGVVKESCFEALPVFTPLADQIALEISQDSSTLLVQRDGLLADSYSRVDNCPPSNRHEGCY